MTAHHLQGISVCEKLGKLLNFMLSFVFQIGLKKPQDNNGMTYFLNYVCVDKGPREV